MKKENILKLAKEWSKTNRVWIFTFCSLSLLLVAINWASIRNNNIESGDFAANSLLVQDAKHFALLKGNYSRMGFNHPGPAILYCLAFGEAVFYDWLPIAGSPFSGQLAGVALYIALWLTLMARICKRYNNSFTASLLFVSLFMVVSTLVPSANAGVDFYMYCWMPLLYFFPFAAFLLAISRLAIGKMDSLSITAISAGFLINGHASFIALVPIIAFAALALNFLSNFIFEKRYSITFKSLLENKKEILFAFGILFIFLLPMMALTIIEYPGPLAQYYHFSKLHTANSLKGAYHFVAFYWGGNVGLLWGTFSLLIVLFTIHGQKSVEWLWGIFSIVIASTATMLYYAITGVDMLNQPYIGFFYFAAPVLFVAAVFYDLITSVLPLKKTGFSLQLTITETRSTRSILFDKKTGLCLLSAVCLLLFAKLSFINAVPPDYDSPQVKVLYDSLNRIKLKEERIVMAPNDWGDFVGLANYAKRSNNSLFCIPKKNWHIICTDALRCTPEEEANNSLRLYARKNPDQTERANASFHISDWYFFPWVINPEPQRDHLIAQYDILGDGWSSTDPDFSWSVGKKASLQFYVRPPFSGTIALDVSPFLPKQEHIQKVSFYIENNKVAEHTFAPPAARTQIPISLKDYNQRMLTIEIEIENPISPKAAGMSEDSREIGIGIYGAEIKF